MVESGSLWGLFPRSLREFPIDLTLIIVIVVVTTLTTFVSVFQRSPVRIFFGLVFVLFAPGYAFIAALFPEDGTVLQSRDDSEGEKTNRRIRDQFGGHSLQTGINGIERIALSIGLSIVISTSFGLALNYTILGVRLPPVVVTLSVFTLVATGAAALRRSKIPPENRFLVSYHEWYAAVRSELRNPDTSTDVVLNVFVIVAVVLSLGVGSYVMVASTQDEQFSSIYILTEDNDGNLVAGNYSSEFESGESQELIIGVDNHEQRPVAYTVVAVEQTVETDGNETVVMSQNELDRFASQLSHGESWRFRHDLEPTMTGENVRVAWLVYIDGDVPPQPSLENADSSTYLWLTVSES
ncbi:DUF1616 domain-containing protein [Natrinema altunense]|uniref:DUF1616 domain-containing protein n=1 Tax=Natrinema altunense TaxID=222984 RepID=A0A482XZM2_9EURY|nr:DUF1616 domain-containing protein [Natrinema altunense]RZH69171.1 DUF1616 domain-containing protein [Natrinema altunense]